MPKSGLIPKAGNPMWETWINMSRQDASKSPSDDRGCNYTREHLGKNLQKEKRGEQKTSAKKKNVKHQ